MMGLKDLKETLDKLGLKDPKARLGPLEIPALKGLKATTELLDRREQLDLWDPKDL